MEYIIRACNILVQGKKTHNARISNAHRRAHARRLQQGRASPIEKVVKFDIRKPPLLQRLDRLHLALLLVALLQDHTSEQGDSAVRHRRENHACPTGTVSQDIVLLDAGNSPRQATGNATTGEALLHGATARSAYTAALQ